MHKLHNDADLDFDLRCFATTSCTAESRAKKMSAYLHKRPALMSFTLIEAARLSSYAADADVPARSPLRSFREAVQ
jgi:hypothetical protein